MSRERQALIAALDVALRGAPPDVGRTLLEDHAPAVRAVARRRRLLHWLRRHPSTLSDVEFLSACDVLRLTLNELRAGCVPVAIDTPDGCRFGYLDPKGVLRVPRA